MGALKSGAFPVELNGKEYGLLFSLNALDEVQEKFGGYDKLSEVFNKDNPNLFKDTRWLLTLLINEALLAEDENAQLLEEKTQEICRKYRTLFLNRSTEELRETTATQRTKTTEKKQQKRETGQPCRKIRYCTAFVYCSSAFEIQGT
jgi:hypothetical protein